jgi:HPt (histidine-containing phosphotransfer) domain-containing protein
LKARAKGATPDRELVDESRLLDRVGGDRKALARLVRLFVTDSRTLLARVREAVERGQAKDLRSAAHTLKGSVSNFAAPAATAAAARLQEIGERGDLTQASLAQASLEQELARVRERLLAIVAGGSGKRGSRSAAPRSRTNRRPKARPRAPRR